MSNVPQGLYPANTNAWLNGDYARSLCKLFLSQMKSNLKSDTPNDEISKLVRATLEVLDLNTKLIRTINQHEDEHRWSSNEVGNCGPAHRTQHVQSHSWSGQAAIIHEAPLYRARTPTNLPYLHQRPNFHTRNCSTGSDAQSIRSAVSYGDKKVDKRVADRDVATGNLGSVSSKSGTGEITSLNAVNRKGPRPTFLSDNLAWKPIDTHSCPTYDRTHHQDSVSKHDRAESQTLAQHRRSNTVAGTTLGYQYSPLGLSPSLTSNKKNYLSHHRDGKDNGLLEVRKSSYEPSLSVSNAKSRNDPASLHLKKSSRVKHRRDRSRATTSNQCHTFSILKHHSNDKDLADVEQVAILTTQRGKPNLTVNPNAKEKPENQDRGMIVHLPGGYSVYGIFDGHGSDGHHISEFVMRRFMTKIHDSFVVSKTPRDIESVTDSELTRWLNATFLAVNDLLKESTIPCQNSGTTATVAFALNGRVIIATAGDSKAAMYRWEKNQYLIYESPEHCPSAPNERDRIERMGGSVKEIYIPSLGKTIARIEQSGLSVSRAFGDFSGTDWGVICDPDVVKFDLPRNNSNRRAILAVASDGVWDCVSSQEIISILSSVDSGPLTREVVEREVEKLCTLGWERRYVKDGRADDTTVLVAFIKT